MLLLAFGSHFFTVLAVSYFTCMYELYCCVFDIRAVMLALCGLLDVHHGAKVQHARRVCVSRNSLTHLWRFEAVTDRAPITLLLTHKYTDATACSHTPHEHKN